MLGPDLLDHAPPSLLSRALPNPAEPCLNGPRRALPAAPCYATLHPAKTRQRPAPTDLTLPRLA
jgi:hypothetical protein